MVFFNWRQHLSYLHNVHPAPLPKSVCNRNPPLPFLICDLGGMDNDPRIRARRATLGERAGVDDHHRLDDLYELA